MQKILVVEDDFDIQELLQNFLQEAGYEVAVANDGVDPPFLSLLKQYYCNIIFSALPQLYQQTKRKIF